MTDAVEVTDNNSCEILERSNITLGKVSHDIEKYEATLIILLGFGGFSILLGLLYNFIRKNVFDDSHNLDTTFDAGGNVSMSLTAVTVASQLLWPGDLLQSATVAIKNGIAGTFWYSVGAVVNMILFPVLSVHFKTRSPGAKTFLQVIYARFGKTAHIVFCFFALLTNLVVMTCLLTGGTATIQSLTKDASGEFCVLLMATLFGSYSFIGGLGSTFYVSYFNTVLVFVMLCIFIINIFYKENSGETALLGSIDNIYEKVTCLKGPEGNEEQSYLTFWSEGALIWGIQGIFATSSLTFCDQASWQSRIAAKPVQGVLGFLAASFIWFAIPSSIGTSTGLAYLALSATNSTFKLSDQDIDAGLVTPFIVQKALGYSGGFMVLTMLTMSLMSTGSGEVMAVSSIIVYDIYQSHLRPYRKHNSSGSCLLCGQPTPLEEPISSRDPQLTYCQCPSATDCLVCQKDQLLNDAQSNLGQQTIYRCEDHGQFRMYQDSMIQFKSWCILWVTIGIVPLGMLLNAAGIDLNWTMMVGFIITTPCFPGSVLSIIWVKTTAVGVVAGSIIGLIGGVSATLIVASTFDGGLGNFLANTSQNYSVLAGSSSSFIVSLSVTIIVSLITHKITDQQAENKEWQKLRDIDNPLRPWSDQFKEDLPNLQARERPTLAQLDTVFQKAKLTAYIGGAFSLLLFIVVMPGVMASLHVLTSSEFRTWLMTLQFWCFLMAAIVVIVAPVEEAIIIVKHMRKKKANKKLEINGGNLKKTNIEGIRETEML
ncbi:uncharacterized protein LOC121373965 [Gigantopelta aegis]|uniref:uncharacterized protein LOC121373965 n=1 Tax=Gigantopelta aegis TaxID=1735272 RepID=UPI001B889DE6|nr:uncharacterized protein LOC121373965 [Gigantopelta aegis]